MRQLPENFHILLIGGGPEEFEFRRQCMVYGLTTRVHIRGDVPYAELPGYIKCMDIGIVPSHTTRRWKEQFGRVLVEFMSCEVPVIGSGSGSIPEVLGDSSCIFPEKSIPDMVNIIKTLASSPKENRAQGIHNRTRVVEFYSAERMAQQLLEMYARLAAC